MEQEAMKNESANAAVEKGEKKAAKAVTRATKARRQKEILKKLLKARAYKWNELLEEAVKEYVAKYDDEEADIPDLKGKFGSNFSLLEADGEVAFDKATNLCTLAGGEKKIGAKAEKSMPAAAEDGGSVTEKADERAKAGAAKAQAKKEAAAIAKETAVVSAADSSADSASSAAEKKAGGDNAGKAEEKPRAKRGRKPMKKEENADTENKAKSGEKQADEKKAAIEKSLKAAVEKAAAKAAVRRTKNDAENVKTIEKKAEEVAAESAAKSAEEKISSGEKTDAEISVAEEKPTAKRRGRKPVKKTDDFSEKASDTKATAATEKEKSKDSDNRENTKNTPTVITAAEKNEAGEEKTAVSTDVPAEKKAKIDGAAAEKQASAQAKGSAATEKSGSAFEAFGFIGRDESAKKTAEQSAEKNERENRQEKKAAKNDFLTDFIFLGNAAKKSGNEEKEAKKSVAGENKNATAETAEKTENVAAPDFSAEKKESAKTGAEKTTPKGSPVEKTGEITRNAAAENVPAEAKNEAKPSAKNEKEQGQGRGNRENAKSEMRAAIQPAAQAQTGTTNGGRGARNGQRTPRVTEKYAQSADDKLKEEFLKRLRSLSGEYFEYYSVYLLERYSLKSGRRLEGLRISGGKNDGGIDGEIELTDRFGFRETIYIQAKNWDPTKGLAEKWMIGETLIQQFVGAATCRQSKDGKRNCRGIFVTTSTFTKEAKEVLSVLGEKFIGYDGNDVYETAKECGFGLIQVNGVWQLDEKLLSSDKAFFNM